MEVLDVPFDEEDLEEMRWILDMCAQCGAGVRVDPRDHRGVRTGNVELRCPDCGDNRGGRTVSVGSLDELAHLADRDEDLEAWRGRAWGSVRERGSGDGWFEEGEFEDEGFEDDGFGDEIFEVLDDEDEEW